MKVIVSQKHLTLTFMCDQTVTLWVFKDCITHSLTQSTMFKKKHKCVNEGGEININ